MLKECVKIVAFSEGSLSAAAAASRISTTAGDALTAFGKSGNREKDLKLVGKVLSSGHNTVIEHAWFTLAFNDVSVLAEQAMIEHRLAAYTVKSRRYVNFSGAGYLVPEGMNEEKQAAYQAHMDRLFSDYTRLTELGVPCEDARFVLPYCFRSNFIMSVNARELSQIVGEMTSGRLSVYPELRRLGEQLKTQLEECFPGVMNAYVKPAFPPEALPRTEKINDPAPARQETLLAFAPEDPEAILNTAMAFNGHESLTYKQLVRSERPRELEMLNYTFRVNDVSLACVTHFTRHRIQSLLVPAVVKALEKNAYVLPDTIRQNPQALEIYTAAFRDNAEAARAFLGDTEVLPYFALAGNTVDLLFGMNARELRHFLRLRTCTRAQWEIRASAREMLALLVENFRDLFRHYGPSCAVLGYCPEGRLSCGRIQKSEEN